MNKPYYHHKRRYQGQDPLGNIFKVIFAPLKLLFKKKLDYNHINRKWAEIDSLLSANSDATLKTAVMEADKLFDYYLQNLGYRGESTGERLKSAKFKLGKGNNDVWQAHILRNKIVHETDCKIDVRQAYRAVKVFRKNTRNL